MNQVTVTDCSMPPVQPASPEIDHRDHYLHKILCANEQMIKSQCSLISRLRQQLQNSQRKYNQVERKLQIYQQSSPGHHQSQFQNMECRIHELQKQLLEERNKLALKQQTSSVKSIKSSTSSQGVQVLRENISNFVNVEIIRKDQQYFARKRKNSQQEDQNMPSWVKAIDFYSHDYKTEKFKQKTLSLVKKFIPHQIRTKVWPLVFENRLGITNGLYIQLLQRRNQKFIPDSVVEQIDKDLQRSFSGKAPIENKTGLSIQVAEVLQIFHIYRPDVSYIQGMTYPVIVLVVVVGKIKAFRIFSNLVLSNEFFRRLFTFDSEFIKGVCRSFQNMLKEQNSELAAKLQSHHINSEIFLVEWFFTFFSRGLSFDFTLRVWDLLAYHGQITFFRLALSIFSLIGPRLASTTYEETIGLIRDYSYYIDEKKLGQAVLSHKLSQQKLESCFAKNSKPRKNS